MSLSRVFKRHCPGCLEGISLKHMDTRFNCPHCGVNLAANVRQSWFWLFVGGLVVFPFLLFGAGVLLENLSFTKGGFIELKLILGFAYAGLVVALRPILIRIKIAE